MRLNILLNKDLRKDLRKHFDLDEKCTRCYWGFIHYNKYSEYQHRTGAIELCEWNMNINRSNIEAYVTYFKH